MRAVRISLLIIATSLVGCSFSSSDLSPGPLPSVLGPSVVLPEGTRLVCSRTAPTGAFVGDAAYSPIAARIERNAGTPLRYTTYVLPAPHFGDPMNMAQAFFAEHLPAGANYPLGFFGMGGATHVVAFPGPLAAGARGYEARPWFVELYRGVSAGHVFSCGQTFNERELLVVMIEPVPDISGPR